MSTKEEEVREEVRSDASEKCPHCFGVDGHHLMNCPDNNADNVRNAECDERNPAEGNDEIPPPTPEEQLSHAKLPPSPEMLVGNELLWLIARTCHEVNRAYCVGVTSDHSHRPWDEAPSWQRESCYEGVLKHYENPEFTAEDSHRSWMAKKIEEGWVFGNMKNETERTHPNLVPYHTLHIHERTKDEVFSAICKSMLGGMR